MLVSFSWLKQFIASSDKLRPDDVARRLTMSTVEVEGFRSLGSGLEDVVVGTIEKIDLHPNADKLKICRVNVGGKKLLQIVCGGSNVSQGMKVALAKVGAKVKWHGQGDLVELKPAEIRGAVSEGMICASDEIGLGEMFPKNEAKEILDLSHLRAKSGTPMATALGLDDVIFEIDNKSLSNRPDLWGHYGLAREVAALFKQKLKPYLPAKIEVEKKVKLAVRVEDKKLCPRYMAVVLEDVAIVPSPRWMQERLRSVGLRPINNIVDITNYVMLELGQPMHAFDAASLFTANTVVVRRAKTGEKLWGLDGKEYLLNTEMLIIADSTKPIAIAGVMGGESSGVSEKTHTIIFEAATFAAASVRKTALALGLRTESSMRFEKGLSVERAELGLRRAVELMREICPDACVASRVVDIKNFVIPARPITLSNKQIASFLGIEIPFAQVRNILTRLGFRVAGSNDRFRVVPPNWRSVKDIAIAEDVMEEIIRVYGYDRIPSSLPSFPIAPPAPNPLRSLERTIKELLALENGCTEVYNYSFVSEEYLSRLGENASDFLALANPVAKDRPLVRRSLIPNLLINVEENLHRRDTARLFEVGRVYHGDAAGELASPHSSERLPRQDLMLGMVYSAKAMAIPFYELSGMLSRLSERLGVQIKLQKQIDGLRPWQHPGRTASLLAEDSIVGYITELHPASQQTLGIATRVALLEMNLTSLLPFIRKKSSYTPVSLYPAVTRDIAFMVNQTVEHQAIAQALQGIDPLLVATELFDVYYDSMATGKKSLAYHLTYQNQGKTLQTSEADAIHKKVEAMLRNKFMAEIR